MRARRIVCGAVIVSLSIAAPASAGWLKNMFRSIHTDYQRNISWPRPFVLADRDAVWAPMTAMVYNGWKLQNTLTEDHFVDETAELNEAGRARVRDICINTPRQFRAIFVLSIDNEELNADRLAQVQELASRYAIDQEVEVLPSTKRPESWPADEVNGTYQKFIETQQSPRLPEEDGSSSGGGSE